MKGQDAETVERLTGIGLEEREAKLYVDLLVHGPSRASDAAARVKLKRTETYRALESLMERGFVTAQLTRPVQYEALGPDVVFADLLARHEQRRSEIEKLREHVREMASQARATTDAAGRYAYRIIQGRRAIFSALESMLRSANDAAMASAHFSPASATPSNRTFYYLVQRAGEGMPLRMLAREQPNMDRALQPLAQHANVKIRFGDLPRGLRFLIVDDRELVIWLVSDPAPGVDAREDVAMWTNAPDFIAAQRALFEAMWSDARESMRMSSLPR